MARTILSVGAAVWLLAGAAGLALATLGTEWLLGVLPPLAIGADALARAVGAFSFGLLVIGAAHMVVLSGLRARARWSHSAAILLAGMLAAGLLTLAVSALTGAADQPASAPGLIAAALTGGALAAAYALATARLVAEMRTSRGV